MCNHIMRVFMQLCMYNQECLFWMNTTAIPTGNNVHVTCMFHANFINLHAQQNIHVIMLMYMHVSCNTQ